MKLSGSMDWTLGECINKRYESLPGELLLPVSGLWGSIHGGVSGGLAVQGLSMGAASGAMEGTFGDHVAIGDVLEKLAEGDVASAAMAACADAVGPGGAASKPGQGDGLGVKGLLGNALNLADGLLGIAGELSEPSVGRVGMSE
ncbi:hypothetical protein [Paracoccus methylarcula]|uniref:hypothetical protein n=1 Tax=Paracoccus methylarcula TaxID=72022 RepID=UPI0011CD980C|nr:hypothetical protein [Paracoccus methylarcula]